MRAAVLIKVETPVETPERSFWLGVRRGLGEVCHAINGHMPEADFKLRALLWGVQCGLRVVIAAIEDFQLPDLKKSLKRQSS